MNELDIPQEPYFPFTWKLFGGLIILFAFLLLITELHVILKVILFVLLILLALLMITARYGLKVNVDEKTYTIYTFLLGLKVGKPEPFHYIKKFYINQVTEEATVTAYSGLTSNISKKVFKAYMKLDTGDKIHLDTHRKKDVLASKLESYQSFMQALYRPSADSL